MEQTKLQIIKYPHPKLREKAKEVLELNGELAGLSRQMLETMYSANGLGLAANQVGFLKRLVVIDMGQKKGRPEPMVLINPEIIEREGNIVGEEACLSVVDFASDVERSARVLVKAIDLNGKELHIEAEGLFSVCLQHEIDHLDGILFIDHISPLKRGLYKRKLKKLLPTLGILEKRW
ncbi:MAG: peptide deformylase [Desulfatiglandales bacterium]